MVGIGAVFIDDIVLPNGVTYMARLGGGVVHALMGAALWGEKPGIVATVGQDLPEDSAKILQNNFDTRGLYTLPIPQIRAWQLFEEDGTRRELYRVKDTVPFIRGAQPEHFTPAYSDCRGFYLTQGFEGIRAWRKLLEGFILWEPLQQVMLPENRDTLRNTLQTHRIDLISPNLVEAQAIYDLAAPDDLVNAMLGDGAQQVALRMGEKGSLVADRDGRRTLIPAIKVPQIVDQTGAGNTYCGGLLWGLLTGKSLLHAAAIGTVSASFCIEQVGVLDPSVVDLTERDQRHQILLRLI